MEKARNTRKNKNNNALRSPLHLYKCIPTRISSEIFLLFSSPHERAASYYVRKKARSISRKELL